MHCVLTSASCSCWEWRKLECRAEAAFLSRKSLVEEKQHSCSWWSNSLRWFCNWWCHPEDHPPGVQRLHCCHHSPQNTHSYRQWSCSGSQWRYISYSNPKKNLMHIIHAFIYKYRKFSGIAIPSLGAVSSLQTPPGLLQCLNPSHPQPQNPPQLALS